jgi:hypothetical protein
MSEERFALIALVAIASWTLIGLPLIYLSGVTARDVLGPFATALSAMLAASVALSALAVAKAQLRLNRLNQRETTAKANFREFLKLCSANPKFGFGHSNPTDSNRAEYDWFVAQFLWAAEEILEFDREDWESLLKLHIAYHQNYLRSDERFRKYDFETYTDALMKFVDDELAELAKRPEYNPARPLQQPYQG